MDSEKATKQGLLPVPSDDGFDTDAIDWHFREAKSSLRKKYIRRFAVIQVVLILLYTTVCGLVLGKIAFRSSARDGEEFTYTPAESVDKFEKTELNMILYHDNPYKGPPNEKVDEAWDSLFNNAYIRLNRDELDKLGTDSVPIPDGSGQYFGALDMYHQLHCVNFIFKYVHQDYYTLRKINVPPLDHINHCIDVLRQVVMCYADTTVSTVVFRPDYERTWPQFKLTHSCRNWDAVDAWAGMPGRRIDQKNDPVHQWLMNPDFHHQGEEQFDGHGEEDPDGGRIHYADEKDDVRS